MRTVNSLSGGKSSSYLACLNPADYNLFSVVCIDDHNANATFWKQNPGIRNIISEKLQKYCPEYGEFKATAEHPQTLLAMLDLEQHLGSEIIWLRGLSFESLIEKFNMIPNRYKRVCTKEFKMRPIHNFVKEQIGEMVDMRIGFRFDEFDRITKHFFQRKKQPIAKETSMDLFNIILPPKVKKKKAIKPLDLKSILSQISPEQSMQDMIERIFALEEIEAKYASGNLVLKPNQPSLFEKDLWRVLSYPLVRDKIIHKQVSDYFTDLKIKFPNDSNCQMCFWKNEQQLRKNFDSFSPLMLWAGVQESMKEHTFKEKMSLLEISKLGLQSQFTFGTGSGCTAGMCTD